MFIVYQLITSFIILFSPIIILIRIFKKKEDKIRFKEKFCFFSKKRNQGKLIWFHGSSVGEIMSVLPIINEYEKNNSIKTILITSSTLSSSKILEKLKFKKVIHQFYPNRSYLLFKKILELLETKSCDIFRVRNLA